jgi:hypothetical protein
MSKNVNLNFVRQNWESVEKRNDKKRCFEQSAFGGRVEKRYFKYAAKGG